MTTYLPHESALPTTKKEIDYFDPILVQTAIRERRDVVHHPLATLDNASSIEFHVSGSGEEFIDLSEIYLTVDVQLQSVDGREAKSTATWGPVNNVLHTLFDKVDVHLNDTPVTNLDNLYAYRAYLANLLSHSTAEKETSLAASGWAADTSGQFDSVSQTVNRGLGARAKPFLGKDRIVTYTGKLHCDVFQQERILPNAVDLRVKLSRSKPEFYMMDTEPAIAEARSSDGTTVTTVGVPLPKYQLKILRAELKVDKVKVGDEFYIGIGKMLEETNALLPIRQVFLFFLFLFVWFFFLPSTLPLTGLSLSVLSRSRASPRPCPRGRAASSWTTCLPAPTSPSESRSRWWTPRPSTAIATTIHFGSDTTRRRTSPSAWTAFRSRRLRSKVPARPRRPTLTHLSS